MNAPQLGRLEPVDLRTVWNNEASDFTPWLAQAENLVLLGETIGLDLELESVEQGVGPYRADIVCKDTELDTVVLIENQLERTDHSHLGQLLTYAAGLDAVTIVWIADRFTDEHRAALDWLNELTPTDVNFFGLEIELWRIQDSPVAPKFNIVSEPNEWIKRVIGPDGGNLTETRRLQLEYWTTFSQYLEESGSFMRLRRPRAKSNIAYGIGRGSFALLSFCNTVAGRIGVILVLKGQDAKPHYYLLEEQKDEIEEALGEKLEWLERPEKVESRIALRRHGLDPKDRDRWLEQHAWLKERLERFYQVFSPRVKALDVADYAEYGDEEQVE